MNTPTIIVLNIVAALAIFVIVYLIKKKQYGCGSDKSKCPTCSNTDCPLKKAQNRE